MNEIPDAVDDSTTAKARGSYQSMDNNHRQYKDPGRVSVFRQYMTASFASISGIACGSSFVWMTSLIPRLEGPNSELKMTSDEISWAVSLVAVGDLFTPIPAALFADILGRKAVLLASAPLYLAAWIILLFTRTVSALYLARILQGMAIGITYTILPIYLGEIASPKIRGSLGVLDLYSWYLGLIFEYSIGPFLSYNTVIWASLSFTIMFAVLFVWSPETPHYLASRDRDAEAAKVMRWLRGGADISVEFDAIRQEVEESHKFAASWCGAWSELVITRKGLTSLGLATAVLTAALMGGLATVLSYTSLFFSKGSEVTCSLILGVLLLLTVPLFGRLMDLWGRRPMYLLSSGVCFLSTLILGFYNLMPPAWLPKWIADAIVILYLLFIAGGVEALCPILQSELFSVSVRALGSSLIIFLLTLLSFVSFQLFFVLNSYVGFYSNFFVFSVFSAIGFVVIYAYLPETKGKTFGEIQQSL